MDYGNFGGADVFCWCCLGVFLFAVYHVESCLLSIAVFFAAVLHLLAFELWLNGSESDFFYLFFLVSGSTARQSLTRPKSFVSTRLLSLEEAQARTQAPLLLQGSPHHAISQFHTVLDLPADKWVSLNKSMTFKGIVNLQIKLFWFMMFWFMSYYYKYKYKHLC